MIVGIVARAMIGWTLTAAAGEALIELFEEEESAPNVVIREPLKAGEKLAAPEPPTKAEVIRAFPRSIWVSRRAGLDFKAQKLTDELGATKLVPLIGPAQVRETRWMCDVTYDLVLELGWERRVTIPRRVEITVQKLEVYLVKTEKE
jgi:hypothetical protein